MTKKSANNKRYNLVLPQKLYENLKTTADDRGATIVELIRKFIQIGLLISKIQDEPGSAFIIREGDSEREIFIF